jgi:endo-1,3(4)-beta-glucanase
MSESERKYPGVELSASPLPSWNVFEKLDLKREYTAIQDVEIEAPSSSERAKIDFDVAARKASNAQRKLFAVTGFFLAGILFFIALLKGSKEKLGCVLIRLTSFRQVTHPEVPGVLWGVVTKPFPTGAFWTNLAVKNGDGAVAVYPYGVKTTDVGIQVSYGAGRRVVSQTSIIDPFAIDFQIAALQGYAGRSIESYDNVSVTMGYRTVGSGKYRTHLVKGSPFITVVYDGATPVISSPAMRILRVDARVVQGSVGVQYIVTLGNFQKWLVYCSEPVALVWKENTLSSPNPIRGVIRVAILPTQNCETAFNTLLGYVQRYPTGAALTFTYPTGTLAYVNFQFNTVGIGPLLMYTLPHHTPILVFPLDSDENRNVQNALSPIWCIKGKLKPMVGDLWKLQYNMVNVGWNYQLTDKLSTSQLDEIARQLMLDVRSVVPTSVDPYTFGKELARMARLALIADNLGIADARQIALGTIEAAILPWLQDTNADALLYDKTYGGVISTNGLADPMADYGSGWYSDHHFHYGYFVYAAATLARLDVPFWDANKQALETIVRDICNPDPSDPDFPFVRHKDFFDGHSWASGLFQQANGKGQESSSEVTDYTI